MEFCTKEQYQAFVEKLSQGSETHITKAGIILIKFWLEVSQDEQAANDSSARIEDPMSAVEAQARWTSTVLRPLVGALLACP